MSALSNKLINWYNQNKRDLPWRQTNDPYKIWVSEIILQQTRVDQGLNYYLRFIESFPSVKSLANANIDSVLKIWQGLGYYSRARNMHYTANQIIKELNGCFPDSFDELKKLKGIGDYTAAAIASISFNKSVPAIDGNVYRVLARIFGIFESTQTAKGKKIFFDKALTLIDSQNPNEFNQAMMEFGAKQCIPRNPHCSICIFKDSCFALIEDKILDLPLKKQKVKKRNRYFLFIHILYKEYTFLQQRDENDIWKLLYQLPLIEQESKINLETIFETNQWKNIFKDSTFEIISISNEVKHLLSHQNISAYFIKINLKKLNRYIKNTFLQVDANKLHNYSTPRLVESYLEENMK